MSKVRPKNYKVPTGVNHGAKEPEITNRKFATSDKWFMDACDKLNISERNRPRQASKFRNKKGIVWKTFKENK